MRCSPAPEWPVEGHISPAAKEEKEILAVLEEWIQRNVPERKRETLMDTGVNRLSKEEVRQKRILGFVERLNKR